MEKSKNNNVEKVLLISDMESGLQKDLCEEVMKKNFTTNIPYGQQHIDRFVAEALTDQQKKVVKKSPQEYKEKFVTFF